MLSIDTLLALLVSYKYLLIVPLSLVAQPLVGMLAGVLSRLGVLDWFVVYPVLVTTALCGDVLIYIAAARWGGPILNRWGRYVSITPQHVASAHRVFDRYHAPILLVSKLVNGFGFAWVTLFTAGLTRVPFGRYVLFNAMGEVVWSAIILSVGYFFSDVYLRVDTVLGKISLIMFFVFGVLVFVGLARHMHKRLVSGLE